MNDPLKISAIVGDRTIAGTLQCNTYGGGSWLFACGDLIGHFFPSCTWGWRYEGSALELQEIIDLIEIISNAEGIPIEVYNCNTPIPWWARRAIFSREEFIRACNSINGPDNFFEELKIKYPNLCP